MTEHYQHLARKRFGLGMDGAQDAVDDACIVQEVLAKTLARLVLVLLGHSRVSAI